MSWAGLLAMGSRRLLRLRCTIRRPIGWQPLPSMPTTRHSLAAAAVAGKVYAIGGLCGPSTYLCDAVEAYDPISGAWTRVASLSVARCGHTAAVIEGKIYVLGGSVKDPNDEDEWVDTDRVDAYDPVADSWQQMAAMPTAKASHAAASLDGKIYVTGGRLPSGSFSDALHAYDPMTETWTTLTSLIQARAYHATAIVDGKMWVFGGYTSDGRDKATVEVYSPESNSWARAADLPGCISEGVAVAL